MAQRIKLFLLGYGPLLTTIVVFILAFLIGGWLYPAMKNPQVFFNLFINGGSLLLVSIGMTLVILTKGIDLSVGGVIALTTAASAALLRAGVSPFVVIPLMVIMGSRVRVYARLHYSISQSAAFHRNPDGAFFRTRDGLHH